MSSASQTIGSTVIPCLRYRNAPAIIEWLCEVFGFEKHLVVPPEDADAVLARAQTAGAEILIPIKDGSYGGRGFTCHDLEGHIRCVGTDNAWEAEG